MTADGGDLSPVIGLRGNPKRIIPILIQYVNNC